MRTIDLDSLEIFRTVLAEGGIVRAAGKLNRVQSNVTTRIQQLEERLGHKLFRREGRSLALSPAGAALLPYADRLLRLAQFEFRFSHLLLPLDCHFRFLSKEASFFRFV